MQILTPSGYKDIADCAVGDEVSAFDMLTGAPIVNTIETLQWVDAEEWARWWQVEPTAPPFQFFRINGTWTLNSEQSIWRNGASVCHARDIVVGDVIYDDADHDVTIVSIEEVSADGWWRLDISGDHSYIVDGLTLHNASRFWVGGTGTWDSSTTTQWAALTNGTGGQTVPGSADTVTLDGSSGGGTVTLNFGGTITIQSITLGAFTGTFDNSVNNNNMTLSASSNAFNNSGSGTRTIKLGTANYTLSSNAVAWNFQSAANCTYTGGSSTVTFPNGGTGHRSFNTGGLTQHGNVIFGSSSGAGAGYSINNGSSSGTLASLTIAAPNFVQFATGGTTTITAAINWAGSSSSHIGINSDTYTLAALVAVAAGSTCAYCGFHDVFFTGSPTASNSLNLGNVSGITITGPSGGGGYVIGS